MRAGIPTDGRTRGRLATLLGVLAVALLATLGGALLGWGVMRVQGGASAFTQPPTRLSLVQRVGPGADAGAAPDAASARPARPARWRGWPGPGPNRPDRWTEGEVPRLAIVIDDIGHTLWAPRTLLDLDAPLTFSVLPDLPHSQDAARLIARAGREFIIHLPMEPVDYPLHDPGPSPLLLSQGAAETRARVEGFLRELPGATGASNHMGSAYTADPARMQVVQQLLADRDLFFLNSKTSPTGVPAEIAQEGRFAYLERDVFLDNERDEARIARALRQALARARQRGRAIAIGHPYPETVHVLQAALTGPGLDGVELVSLSALLPR